MVLLYGRDALLLGQLVELFYNPCIYLFSSHKVDLAALLILSRQEKLLSRHNKLDFLLCSQNRIVQNFE